jgi:hypothetical protein
MNCRCKKEGEVAKLFQSFRFHPTPDRLPLVSGPLGESLCALEARKSWVSRLSSWGRSDVHTKMYSENVKEKDHLGNVVIDRRIILKWILKKEGMRM